MKNPKHTRTAILTVRRSGRIVMLTYRHNAGNRGMMPRWSERAEFASWATMLVEEPSCVYLWRDECRIIVRSSPTF